MKRYLLGLALALAATVSSAQTAPYWQTVADAWVRIDGGLPVSAGYLTIKDETTARPQESILTFLGAGVSCVDNAGNAATECTIAGGGGSTPTGTGFVHVTAGVQDGASKLVDTADVNASQITYAKIQNSAAGLTLLGRAANSSGVFAEIAASAASDCVYRESASALACGTVATAGLANNAVTVGKLAQAAAFTVLGNDSAATANVAALAGPGVADVMFQDNTFIYRSEEWFTTCGSSGVCGDLAWRANLVNTGNSLERDDSTGHPGVIDLTTGTSASGASEMYVEDTNQTGGYRLGGSTLTIRFNLNVPVLSTSSERFIVRSGFNRGPNTVTNGVWVEYTESNDTHWRICAAKASTTTCTNTTNTVTAGQWDFFEITINAAATSVDFKINGSTASGSPLSTNIPNTVGIAPVVEIIKTVGGGATASHVYQDYFKFLATGLAAR